jgi:hypothetical protein
MFLSADFVIRQAHFLAGKVINNGKFVFSNGFADNFILNIEKA